MITVGLNGFGRIGRNFVRAVLLDPEALKKLRISAINIGPANTTYLAQMFQYDTLMGIFPGSVSMKENKLVINEHEIEIIAETDPRKIDWKKYDVSWVVDATGKFTKREGAEQHITAGASHVLITAPAHDEDISIIPGVNETSFNQQKDIIVSLGSCTTNAFIPTLKVLQDTCGIKQGFMTTTHAYTNTQVLLDVNDHDPRRARAATLNIIPTTTGASKMLDKILPSLKGKVLASAIRVPVAKVSLIDLTFIAEKEISKTCLNDYFKAAAQSGNLKGILGFSDLPLVSSDYAGDSRSVIIDGLLTDAQGSMGKIFGWYDNEWAYSVRLKDFLMYVNG